MMLLPPHRFSHQRKPQYVSSIRNREQVHVQHHLRPDRWLRGQFSSSPAIGCACHLSLCVSFPCLSHTLTAFLCRFGFLHCDTAFQWPIRYNLTVSSQVFKHAYVAERSAIPDIAWSQCLGWKRFRDLSRTWWCHRLENHSERGICPSWQVVLSGISGFHRAFHFSMLCFSLLIFL